MLNNKTGFALVLGVVISTTAVAALPAAIHQEWSFDTEANPALSSEGVPASIQSGALASGWIAALPELPGGAGGYWDVGSVGGISCNLSNVIPAGAAVGQITVRVKQWWDGGIYGAPLAISIPGTVSGSTVQDLSNIGPLGGWVVDTTVLTPAAGFKRDTLAITAGLNGAIMDSLIVEATTVTLPPLVLEIHPDASSPGSIQLSWDATLGAATIESSSTLNNPSGWVSLEVPVQLVNGRYTATIAAGEAAKFFRLRK